jgi:hypothetical protein
MPMDKPAKGADYDQPNDDQSADDHDARCSHFAPLNPEDGD